MASTATPEHILKELSSLWVSLGKQQNGNSMGVQRACAMTLIVATEGQNDEVGETLARLVQEHPSRAIVLRLLDGSQHKLAASVVAQCWTPYGTHQQICCEQIDITVSEDSLPALPYLLCAIVAPDLPIVIWSRARRLLDVPAFEPVRKLAHKLIVDSAGVSDLKSQLRAIASASAGGKPVADLEWTRITQWRESIAQVFDAPVCRSRLAGFQSLTIGYKGDHVPMQACYMAAWIRYVLGRALPTTFERVGDAPAGGIDSIRLAGDSMNIALQATDGSIELHADVHNTRMVFPPLTDCELLREELSLLNQDIVFAGSLEHVAELLA